MKSIVLFGKGPSVSKCSHEIVEKYNDVAIVNYPVLNSFFMSLISDKKIKYHFANCNSFDEKYTDKINDILNIECIINTNSDIKNHYIHYLRNKHLFKASIHEQYNRYFQNNFDLDPNSGIMGLQYIIDTGEYNDILLVGFDNFKKNEQMYYYPIDSINKKLKYLIEKNIITKEGNLNIVSGHNPQKTEIYLSSLKIKYPHIKVERL